VGWVRWRRIISQHGRVQQARAAHLPAVRGRHRPGVRRPLAGVGAFHLGEQRQQHHRQLPHRIGRVGRVDLDRIGQVAHPDAALGQLMDQVQRVTHGAAQPVQGVDHDYIASLGEPQHRPQPRPVHRRPGLLIQVDTLPGDPDCGQRVDLPLQVLLGRRLPRVPQLHTADGTRSQRRTGLATRRCEATSRTLRAAWHPPNIAASGPSHFQGNGTVIMWAQGGPERNSQRAVKGNRQRALYPPLVGEWRGDSSCAGGRCYPRCLTSA